MVNMENAEEVMQILERFTRLKQKEIPKELDEYLQYVAKTGDTVFKWSSLKYLFREKLINVMKHFHDTTQHVVEIPQYPNVDPFNYESMKSSLLERLELFNAAPFTIQRLCELLIDPRKQYSRIDKFMRALEKNILVSTIEPGRKRTESENCDSLDSVVNGDLSLEVNVDIDMENESLFNVEAQNGNGTSAVAAENESGSAAPVADKAKVKEKIVSESPKATHTTDDDILPNPKKAKLDLEEDAETESAASTGVKETVAVGPADVVDEGKAIKEQQQPGSNDVFVESVKGKRGEDKENLVASDNSKEKAASSSMSKKAEVEEKPAVVEKKQNQDKTIERAAKKDVEKKVVAASDKHTKVEQENTEVYAAIKADKAKKTVATVEKKAAGEASAEKQETGKGAKQHKDEVTKKEIDTQQNKQKAAVAERKSDAEIKQAVEKKGKQPVSEEAVKAVDTTKQSVEILESSNESVANKEEDKKVDVHETQAPQEQKTAAKVATTLNSSDDKVNIPETTEVKINTDDAVASAAKSTDSEKAVDEISTSSSAKEEKTGGESTAAAAAAVVIAKCKSTVAENKTTSRSVGGAEPAASVASAICTTSKLDAEALSTDVEKTSSAAIAAETKTPSSITSIPTEKRAPISIAIQPPALALNDQLMEEPAYTPLEEDIEVSEAATAGAITSPVTADSAVEEVTMSEASCGGATAMATDAINEATKDEPAGMEVDDTSQEEAMDQ